MAEIKGASRDATPQRACPPGSSAWASRTGRKTQGQRALEGDAAEGAVHRHRAARARGADPRRADERPRPGGDGPDARGAARASGGRARRSCSPATRWRRWSGCATAWPSSTAARRSSTGPVSEVKTRYGKNTRGALLRRRRRASWPALPGVAKVTDFGRYVEVQIAATAPIPRTCCRQAAARLRREPVRDRGAEPARHLRGARSTGHGAERRRVSRHEPAVADRPARVPGARALQGLRHRHRAGAAAHGRAHDPPGDLHGGTGGQAAAGGRARRLGDARGPRWRPTLGRAQARRRARGSWWSRPGEGRDRGARAAPSRRRCCTGRLDGYLHLPADALDAASASYFGKNVSNVIDLRMMEDAVSETLVARRLAGAGLDPGRVEELDAEAGPQDHPPHRGRRARGPRGHRDLLASS